MVIPPAGAATVPRSASAVSCVPSSLRETVPRSKGFSAEYVVEMTSDPVSGATGAVAENGTVAEVDAL